MIRFVVRRPGIVLVDVKQDQPGRGYYICSQKSCLEKARGHQILNRLTGQKVPDSAYLAAARILGSGPPSLDSWIGFARKTHEILLGMTALKNGLPGGRVKMLLMDEQTKRWTREKVQSWSEKGQIPLLFLESGKLEALTGKQGCRVAGITHTGLVSQIMRSQKSTYK